MSSENRFRTEENKDGARLCRDVAVSYQKTPFSADVNDFKPFEILL